MSPCCLPCAQKVYRYFDGDNLEKEKMNMTTPVLHLRRRICSPVLCFMLPAAADCVLH